MKSAEFEELKDMITGMALAARQSGSPSHVLIDIQNNIKSLVEKTTTIETQTIKTNGRVTRLEKIVLIASTVLAVLGVIKYPVLLNLIHAL